MTLDAHFYHAFHYTPANPSGQFWAGLNHDKFAYRMLNFLAFGPAARQERVKVV